MSDYDRFYGEALREMESGARRDDLWGKAFASAKGDVQKAKGLYLEQLARLLATQAGAKPKLEPAAATMAMATSVGTAAVTGAVELTLFMRYWLIRAIPCAILAWGLMMGSQSLERTRQINEAQQAISANTDYPFAQGDVFRDRTGRVVPRDEALRDFQTLGLSSSITKYGVFGNPMSSSHERATAGLREAESYRFSTGWVGFIFCVLFTALLLIVRTVNPRKPSRVDSRSGRD